MCWKLIITVPSLPLLRYVHNFRHLHNVGQQVLSTFTHGQSTDSEGLVLVTDSDNLTDLQSRQ